MDEEKCDFCGHKHKTTDCRKRKTARASLAKGAINELPKTSGPRKFKDNCNNCGKYGHTKRDCPSKTDAVLNVMTESAVSSPGEAALAPPPYTTMASASSPATAGNQFSQSQLKDLMQKISSGQATVSLVRQASHSREHSCLYRSHSAKENETSKRVCNLRCQQRIGLWSAR